MEEEVVRTLKQVEEEAREEMQKPIEANSPLKELFVNYVGGKYQPESGAVTVEMCVHALAEEFPEFLAPVSEQNFMLGYQQCQHDMDLIMQQHRQEIVENLEEGANDE